MQASRAAWKPNFGEKFVTSTTSVLPSQRPRESPNRCRIEGEDVRLGIDRNDALPSLPLAGVVEDRNRIRGSARCGGSRRSRAALRPCSVQSCCDPRGRRSDSCARVVERRHLGPSGRWRAVLAAGARGILVLARLSGLQQRQPVLPFRLVSLRRLLVSAPAFDRQADRRSATFVSRSASLTGRRRYTPRQRRVRCPAPRAGHDGECRLAARRASSRSSSVKNSLLANCGGRCSGV